MTILILDDRFLFFLNTVVYTVTILILDSRFLFFLNTVSSVHDYIDLKNYTLYHTEAVSDRLVCKLLSF